MPRGLVITLAVEEWVFEKLAAFGAEQEDLDGHLEPLDTKRGCQGRNCSQAEEVRWSSERRAFARQMRGSLRLRDLIAGNFWTPGGWSLLDPSDALGH